jgi:hypothetical protein
LPDADDIPPALATPSVRHRLPSCRSPFSPDRAIIDVLEQETKNKLLIVVSIIGLAFAGVLSTSSSAAASAEGCTWAPSGYVCNYTHGSGAYVSTIDAIRGRSSNLICNYAADASVQDPWGRVVWFGHQSHQGCTPARAWFTFKVYRTFRCGYVTSVAWFESGVRQGGYANVNLC